MPFSYTNRRNETHYFRKVATGKGGFRYYITKNPAAQDLIEEVPKGFEVTELPYDGKVVIRKKVPAWVEETEINLVHNAMEAHSPVRDFILIGEKDSIEIHISQFSGYHDALYLSAEEARELYDERVDQWKCYNWILSFTLIDRQKRRFQVIRKASIQYYAVPIDEGDDLEALAEKYCYHVGRESLLAFWIPGEDW